MNNLQSNEEALVKFNAVSRWFNTPSGQFTALREIDLTINSGEYLAIIGKSGSGKTTLLNMLTGIDHPSKGSVRFDNTSIHQLDETDLARWRGRNVGIVFQFFQLVPTLSIEENIFLAMDFVNIIPARHRKKRAADLLERLGIIEHRSKLPAGLSGGQQQRAAIARALANDPPLLVADEPTGNLDSNTAKTIDGIFRELSWSGKTVVVVTHAQVKAGQYGRCIRLSDGSIDEEVAL